MKFIVVKDYAEMSKVMAEKVIKLVHEKPDLTFCIPAGSSPIGMYEELVKENNAGTVDFSKVTTFNMDEYVGLTADHPQSYRYFADHYFLNHINIDRNNVVSPQAHVDNPAVAAETYKNEILKRGGFNITISGVGDNGHIAFNEPNSYLRPHAHLVDLDEATITANSRFFDDIKDVPKQALTIGIADVMLSKNLFIIASGEKKAPIFERLFEKDHIDPQFPITFLRMHPNVTFILDEAAASKIIDKL